MSEVRYAFILRLWFKAERTPSLIIRGSLQPANSDQVYYFASLDELSLMLQRFIDGHSPISPTSHKQGKKG